MRGTQTLKEIKLLPRKRERKKSWVQAGGGSIFEHPQKNGRRIVPLLGCQTRT